MSKKHLLWVDDDGPARYSYELAMLKKDDWTVDWAHSSLEAIESLSVQEYHGVITDNTHPWKPSSDLLRWGGFHMLQWLRVDAESWDENFPFGEDLEGLVPLPSNRQVPVLILSAFYDEEVVKKIDSMPGGDEVSWMAKPAGTEALLAFLSVIERDLRDQESKHILLSLQSIDPAWSEVRRFLSRNPDFLHQMHPRRFEELVAEIFRSHGWEVELTSRTRDGGFDIIAIRKIWPTISKLLVEAKRYRPDRAVGVGVVRGLYGVKGAAAASQVILATSSHVSAEAKREYARVIPWELDFVERDRILAWCGAETPELIKGYGVNEN